MNSFDILGDSALPTCTVPLSNDTVDKLEMFVFGGEYPAEKKLFSLISDESVAWVSPSSEFLAEQLAHVLFGSLCISEPIRHAFPN